MIIAERDKQKSPQINAVNGFQVLYAHSSTVYPKKYAHGFCFAVLCCGYTLTDFPISIRLTSRALWQSKDCPSASKATLMTMDKYFMWIHYERLHNHNKAKHNKTVCIFLGIYCILSWTSKIVRMISYRGGCSVDCLCSMYPVTAVMWRTDGSWSNTTRHNIAFTMIVINYAGQFTLISLCRRQCMTINQMLLTDAFCFIQHRMWMTSLLRMLSNLLTLWYAGCSSATFLFAKVTAKVSNLPMLYLRCRHASSCLYIGVLVHITWWRHQMETFSALLALCAGNSPVPVNSPHKGQWRGALMFSLIYAWINDWVNNREAGDLRRQRGHYDVIVMTVWLT